MPYDTLLYDVAGGVARIVLNRPPVNPVNLTLARELMDVSIRCDEDPSVRAVLLSSTGLFFCVGGDLAAFRDAKLDLPAYVKQTTTYLHAAVSRFARMRAPMIAAVHGPAAGAGASLAFAADLAVAAESASFTLAYTAVGLAPDGSSTWFLPRLVGSRRALELMLTNRTLSAREALEWGLVNEVVIDERVAARSEELAKTLASGATQALGAAKRLLLTSATESLETQMELESRAIADAARTADAREGVGAFLEKRKPSFKGE